MWGWMRVFLGSLHFTTISCFCGRGLVHLNLRSNNSKLWKKEETVGPGEELGLKKYLFIEECTNELEDVRSLERLGEVLGRCKV